MSIAAALLASKDSVSVTVPWWSDLQGAPTCPSPVTSCRIFYVDRSQGEAPCAEGVLTHACVNGEVIHFQNFRPGNLSGDGMWYLPVHLDGEPALIARYPVCMEYFGSTIQIFQASDILAFYNGQNPSSPASSITTLNGVTQLCFDPASVSPNSAPSAEVQSLVQDGGKLASSIDLMTSVGGGLFTPKPYAFCPPPVEIGGTGTISPPATYLSLTDPLPFAMVSEGPLSTAWYGPITVCAETGVAFEVLYDRDFTFDPANENTWGGLALMDSAGNLVSLTSEVVHSAPGGLGVGSVCGDFVPRPFIAMQQGVDNIITTATSLVLQPGTDYFIHWWEGPGHSPDGLGVKSITFL